MEDWVAWHRLYDDSGSPLRARLDRVTFHLRRALDQAPPGPVRLLSLWLGRAATCWRSGKLPAPERPLFRFASSHHR
jgi:hypothetical protein